MGNLSLTPSLTVNFGNVAPGQTADAEFVLLSSLQGDFTDFTATFQHADSLGGIETSLINSVTTHTLIHAGAFNFPSSNGSASYLVEDNPNAANLPDTVYLSNGTTAPVNIASNAAITPTSNPNEFTLTATVTSGWDYIDVTDPNPNLALLSVVRSDGTVLPVSDMAWTTDRVFGPDGTATVEYDLHILDLNSTGSYTVTFATPTTPPSSSVKALPATFTSTAISLSWSGEPAPDGAPIASYDVYVSDNGTQFVPFLLGTTQTSTIFYGQYGHTYGFFSIARDTNGNVQTPPAAAQTTTDVQATTKTNLVVTPNPVLAGQLLTLTAAVTGFDPTGTVSFLDGTTVLGTVPTDNGIATFTTNSLAPGAHNLTASYSGDVENLASNSANEVENVNPANVVASVAINGGAVQRSMVTSITVTFDEVVNPTLLQNAFTLTRVSDGAMIGTINVSSTVINGKTVATLTFAGANTEGSNGLYQDLSLADGNWTLEINAADVVSNGVPLSANYYVSNIKRLFGDATGTGEVDSIDLGLFGTTFGLTLSSPAFLSYFDSDGNGIIDSTDLGRFGTNFGLTI